MKVVLALIVLMFGVGANAGYNKLYAEEPLLKKNFIPIVRLLGENDNYGNYNFQSEGADGTKFSENGGLTVVKGEAGAKKSGQVSWTSPEGQQFSMSYTADENGFHPVAAHLPKSPPIPAEIAKSLALTQHAASSSYGGGYGGQNNNNEAQFSAPIAHKPKPHFQQQQQQQSMEFPMGPKPKPMRPANNKPFMGAMTSNLDLQPSPEAVVPILHGSQPLKTHIETPEFTIHSDPSRTFVRIGSA